MSFRLSDSPLVAGWPAIWGHPATNGSVRVRKAWPTGPILRVRVVADVLAEVRWHAKLSWGLIARQLDGQQSGVPGNQWVSAREEGLAGDGPQPFARRRTYLPTLDRLLERRTVLERVHARGSHPGGHPRLVGVPARGLGSVTHAPAP